MKPNNIINSLLLVAQFLLIMVQEQKEMKSIYDLKNAKYGGSALKLMHFTSRKKLFMSLK